MVLGQIRVSNGALREPPNENERPKTPQKTARPKNLVSRIYQDASTRRRADGSSSSSIRSPKYRAQQARRRADARPQAGSSMRLNLRQTPTLEELEQVASGSSTSLAPKMQTVAFPKVLPRIPFKDISLEKLYAVEPELKDMEFSFIRDSLDAAGPDLMKSNQRIRTVADRNALPNEITVIAPDMYEMLPTHMLAVFGLEQPPNANGERPPRKVTLFPVHSMVLLVNCAHIMLPPATLPPPIMGDEHVRLPIWRLTVPAPMSFFNLFAYLYTKNITFLVQNLLPMQPPATLPNFANDAGQQRVYALQLASTFTVEVLFKSAVKVFGLWQNMCSLGVFEDELWDAVEMLWRVHLTALAIATGDPGQMLPAPASETL